jgi:hypothetical protein
MSLGSCSFVPPYLLERIAASSHPAADHCRSTLAHDLELREGRAGVDGSAAPEAVAGQAAWVVHTARNGSTLPGQVVRSAGDAESGDPAVDEAADGVTATLSTYAEAFARSSYDGNSAQVVLTVHYEQNYDNAFWNGTQLVFGDGDGTVFGRFTTPVDVLGHEFTHAVTQFTAGLDYQAQPGALNESVSDCFGMCVKQRALGQTADHADWLVGEGIFLPGVEARALRDMAHPGTAYDDSTLGRDPQVGAMSDYVDTSDDNGGVHINSGIPNRAFYLAATSIGGDTWEGAGQMWYAALTGGQVTHDTDFAGFAAATVAAAGEHADAVSRAWETVGWGSRGPRPCRHPPASHQQATSCAYVVPAGSPGARSRARSTWPPATSAPRRSATSSTGSTWPRPGGATPSRTPSATPSRWAAVPSPCRSST